MRTARTSRHTASGLAFVLATLCQAQLAFADHVVLTNADSLTGTVAAVSRTAVTLETELSGRVTVKWSAVRSMTATGPVRATLATGQTVEGVPAVTDGHIALRQANGVTTPIDPDAVRDLALAASAGAPWSGSLNAGVNSSRGNSETTTVAASGAVTRVGRGDRLGLFGTFLFSSLGSGVNAVTSAQSSRGGLRYDHDVFGRMYGFAFGDLARDPLQLLELRTVAGGGAGAHLANSGRTQLNAFVGASVANDRYTAVTTTTATTTTATTATPKTNPAGKLVPGLSRSGTPPATVRTSLSRQVGEWLVGQDVTHQFSDTVGLTEGLTVFPAIGDWHDYRVSFDLSLYAQLSSWLQWNATVADRFLNIPPAGGAVQNDRYVFTGLGITFGGGAKGAYTGTEARPAAPSAR